MLLNKKVNLTFDPCIYTDLCDLSIKIGAQCIVYLIIYALHIEIIYLIIDIVMSIMRYINLIKSTDVVLLSRELKKYI